MTPDEKRRLLRSAAMDDTIAVLIWMLPGLLIAGLVFLGPPFAMAVADFLLEGLR